MTFSTNPEFCESLYLIGHDHTKQKKYRQALSVPSLNWSGRSSIYITSVHKVPFHFKALSVSKGYIKLTNGLNWFSWKQWCFLHLGQFISIPQSLAKKKGGGGSKSPFPSYTWEILVFCALDFRLQKRAKCMLSPFKKSSSKLSITGHHAAESSRLLQHT